MASPLTHWTNVLRAYLVRGEAGLADVEERLESTAHDQQDGKFSKEQARYLPQAPFPPTLWRTSCGRCRFWEKGAPGEPGRCHVVGRDGDRFGGEAIHYRGWCAFWMPPRGEPPFAWVRERLRPDGKTSVRGEYDPVPTERERRRRKRARVGTEPDARRVAIHDDGAGRPVQHEVENGAGSGNHDGNEDENQGGSENGDRNGTENGPDDGPGATDEDADDEG